MKKTKVNVTDDMDVKHRFSGYQLDTIEIWKQGGGRADCLTPIFISPQEGMAVIHGRSPLDKELEVKYFTTFKDLRKEYGYLAGWIVSTVEHIPSLDMWTE